MASEDSGFDVGKARKKHGALLVSGTAADLGGAPTVDVTDLDELAKIAKKYESMIVEVPDEAGSDFLLWDDGLVYRARYGGPRPAPARTAAARRAEAFDALRSGLHPRD